MERLEFLLLGADLGDGGLAEIVDVEVCSAGPLSQRWGHRCWLHEGGRLGEPFDAERGDGRCDGAVGADGHGGRRQQLRFVELA